MCKVTENYDDNTHMACWHDGNRADYSTKPAQRVSPQHPSWCLRHELVQVRSSRSPPECCLHKNGVATQHTPDATATPPNHRQAAPCSIAALHMVHTCVASRSLTGVLRSASFFCSSVSSSWLPSRILAASMMSFRDARRGSAAPGSGSAAAESLASSRAFTCGTGCTFQNVRRQWWRQLCE